MKVMLQTIIMIGIVVLLFYFNSPITKGKVGENITSALIRLCYKNGILLKNLYVPIKNDLTTEIDLLLITKKGIFVIENKNYKGWIFGNEKSKYWMQVIYNRKNQFFNPVKQNAIHINCLKHILDDNIRFYSIIVFSGNCQLKDISVFSKDTYVIKEYELKQVLDIIDEYNDDNINDYDMNNIVSKLSSFVKENTSQEIIDKHDVYVRERKGCRSGEESIIKKWNSCK